MAMNHGVGEGRNEWGVRHAIPSPEEKAKRCQRARAPKLESTFALLLNDTYFIAIRTDRVG
ncbi:hypothetical protein MUK42_24296 [Musa troglodytarum]|uniref:Uncharacterized protein n=1 Tax=Musa troglodytarum TaxID=320322 RepID=A0A9E7JSP1_9LILI|nr:hypothetical protein MUK42_24296 [Musa troglodytarum]